MIGEWKIKECNLYLNGEQLKSAKLVEKDGQSVVLVNGLEELPDNDLFAITLQKITSSHLIFKSNNTFSWEIDAPNLAIEKEYWWNDANRIAVCKKEDKDSKSPVLKEFEVEQLNDDVLIITSNEGGLLYRYTLSKVK